MRVTLVRADRADAPVAHVQTRVQAGQLVVDGCFDQLGGVGPALVEADAEQKDAQHRQRKQGGQLGHNAPVERCFHLLVEAQTQFRKLVGLLQEALIGYLGKADKAHLLCRGRAHGLCHRQQVSAILAACLYRLACRLGQGAHGLEDESAHRGQDDDTVGIRQDAEFLVAPPQFIDAGLHGVQRYLDHHHATDLARDRYRARQVVANPGAGHPLRNVAPGLTRPRLLKVGEKAVVLTDEGVACAPVARGQAVALEIHQVDRVNPCVAYGFLQQLALRRRRLRAGMGQQVAHRLCG